MQKFVLFAFLFLISCVSSVATHVPSPQSIRYLALGDSYTIGQSVAENERWPNQLATALSDEGVQTIDIEKKIWKFGL
jgi:lysophospholipase L1-like esterase